ncbi:hypothetical protein CCMSSC00406_0007671 [Pleurotus cornucopiae]|uniref:Uncharacterized protein n=1 Tax=Pleurotus cornucopiae TaxID=5321 RepID=A0ACB7J3R0_PLECO|nr:hypothetical protein CCMSSC00406_0007671 [Pleurotus cornucopiae]
MSKQANNPELQGIGDTIVEASASNSDTEAGGGVQEMRARKMNVGELKSKMTEYVEIGHPEGKEASSAEGLTQTEHLAIEHTQEHKPSQLDGVEEVCAFIWTLVTLLTVLAEQGSGAADFEDLESQDVSEVGPLEKGSLLVYKGKTVNLETLPARKLLKLGLACLDDYEDAEEEEDEILFLHNAIRALSSAEAKLTTGGRDIIQCLAKLGYAWRRLFSATDKVEYLEHAISKYQSLCALPSVKRQDYPGYLKALGNALIAHFEVSNEADKLDDALAAFSNALDLVPVNNGSRHEYLSNLGRALWLKFEHVGHSADLEKALVLNRAALGLLPTKQAYLTNLAVALQSGFELWGRLPDLHEAITYQKQIIDVASQEDEVQAYQFSNLGNSYQLLYNSQSDLETLLLAINAHQQAVSLMTTSNPDYSVYLHNLGSAYQSHFDKTYDIKSIHKAIEILEQTVTLASENDMNMAMYVNTWGLSYMSLFQVFHQPATIQKALGLFQRAVALTSEDHVDLPTWLVNLSTAYMHAYESTGQLSDLNNCINNMSKAVTLMSDELANKSLYLSKLGSFLTRKFERFGNVSDIQKAISHCESAVKMGDESESSWPVLLERLATALVSRYDAFEQFHDLQDGLKTYAKALNAVLDDDPERTAHLSNLGGAYRRQFQACGDIKDMQTSLSLLKEATASTPDEHSSKPYYLIQLGLAYSVCYESSGIIEDIDNSISCHQQALSLVPDEHTNRGMHFNNLGNSYLHRFERLWNVDDIELSIQAHKEAVACTPEHHANRALHLYGLGNVLYSRYYYHYDGITHRGAIEDLHTAIELLQEALILTPPEGSNRGMYQGTLGCIFQTLFETSDDIHDLKNAIQANQEAVEHTDKDNPRRHLQVCYLALSYHSKYEKLKQLSSLHAAISCYNEAIQSAPNGHPSISFYLMKLGYAWETVWRSSPDNVTAEIPSSMVKALESMQLEEDLKHWMQSKQEDMPYLHALQAYCAGAFATVGKPSHRYGAAYRLANMLKPYSKSLSLLGYKSVLHILPEHIWLGQSVTERLKQIPDLDQIQTEAATAAINAGEFGSALEWLEQGRSIVWSQKLQLQTSLDNLHAAHPELASKLSKVAKEIEVISSLLDFNGTASQNNRLDDKGQQYRKLVAKWESLLQGARALPSFESLLQPKSVNDLFGAARNTDVVFISLYKGECHALVIRKASHSIGHLHLDKLTESKATAWCTVLPQFIPKARGSMQNQDIERHAKFKRIVVKRLNAFEEMLAALWFDLAKPILEYLGYYTATKPVESSTLPHITWCTTGLLAFLPLHAAGCYDTSLGPCGKLHDYAVSSYTPSLSALLRSHPEGSRLSSIFAVSQTNTPGQIPLPNAGMEVDELIAISSRYGVDVQRLDGEEATVESVLDTISKHTWIHLACHAVQDTTNPLQSGFYLQDGKLTLSNIMKQQFKHGRIAFLSACQTGSGDQNLPEEAMHLAAGIQVSGFPTVFATMWSIKDADAPVVASVVYKAMMEGMKDAEMKPAYALHQAVSQLQAKRGEKDFLSWAPFIHVGI